MRSKLQEKPKSKILKHGYINIYSKLTNQEDRQIYYKTLYKKQNSDWDESMVYLTKKLKSFLSGKEKLLDIGCGNGSYLVDENRKKISWAVGIDSDKQAVGKNICLDEILIGDFGVMPFASGSFDVVTGLWVLEHVRNPEKVFNEIHRVLKVGGKFFFATPNYSFLPLRLIRFIKFLKFNYIINERLFGRERKDVFETYYKASSVVAIKKLSKNKFNIIELRTNFDPSYTSFSRITYSLTKFLHLVSTKFGFEITYPHIIGVLEKI